MDKKILRGAVKAFTLLELIVVIAIIVIMSSILIPNVSNQRRIAKIQAENDQAYQIYVATQDYLNHLQKYGKPAEKYFGCGLIEGRSDCGILVVDEGVIDYKKSVMSGMGNSISGINEAYIGILKRMGVSYSLSYHDANDVTKLQSGKTMQQVRVRCQEFETSGVSFIALVYPKNYTVGCVWATDYKTTGSGNIGSGKDPTVETTHRIYNRITGNVAKKSASSSFKIWTNGFASMSSNGPNSESQENATRYGKTISEPIYMGQYPIPMS